MPGIGSGQLAFYQGFALTRSVFEYANSLWTGFEPVSGVYFHRLFHREPMFTIPSPRVPEVMTPRYGAG